MTVKELIRRLEETAAWTVMGEDTEVQIMSLIDPSSTVLAVERIVRAEDDTAVVLLAGRRPIQ